MCNSSLLQDGYLKALKAKNEQLTQFTQLLLQTTELRVELRFAPRLIVDLLSRITQIVTVVRLIVKFLMRFSYENTSNLRLTRVVTPFATHIVQISHELAIALLERLHTIDVIAKALIQALHLLLFTLSRLQQDLDVEVTSLASHTCR